MAGIMKQCAKSIAVAAAFLVFLRFFQGEWSSMPTSTIVVTVTIIQLFSQASRWLVPAAKDSSSSPYTTASMLSALPSFLSSTEAQIVVVGLLAGLSACFMHAVSLREALVPSTALMLGGLCNQVFKRAERSCQDTDGPANVVDVRSPYHEEFWPKLDTRDEDTSSASILADVAAWGSDILSPSHFNLDTVDVDFLRAELDD